MSKFSKLHPIPEDAPDVAISQLRCMRDGWNEAYEEIGNLLVQVLNDKLVLSEAINIISEEIEISKKEKEKQICLK